MLLWSLNIVKIGIGVIISSIFSSLLEPSYKATLMTLLFMMLGAILSSIVNPNYFGIVERFSTYSVVVYTLIIGIYSYIISKD